MSPAAVGLSLAALSALTSAVAHAWLKAGEDRLAIRAWGGLICAFAALPVALWTGPLPRELWLLMAGFAVLSAANQLILIRSYALSDFSLAYPVARGVVPLAMALLGIIFLGDRLSALGLGGVVAISFGIVSLALGTGMTRHGWGAALLTGATTIGYNLLAAQGMRDAIDPTNFLAWLFMTDGILIPVWLLAQSRSASPKRLSQNFRVGWPAGVATLFSFTALAFAMRLAPVGPVSAIRESSVLIALLLAAYMLKERLDSRRICAGLLIVAGAILIVLAR